MRSSNCEAQLPCPVQATLAARTTGGTCAPARTCSSLATSPLMRLIWRRLQASSWLNFNSDLHDKLAGTPSLPAFQVSPCGPALLQARTGVVTRSAPCCSASMAPHGRRRSRCVSWLLAKPSFMNTPTGQLKAGHWAAHFDTPAHVSRPLLFLLFSSCQHSAARRLPPVQRGGGTA